MKGVRTLKGHTCKDAGSTICYMGIICGVKGEHTGSGGLWGITAKNRGLHFIDDRHVRANQLLQPQLTTMINDHVNQ